jgi:hypothetical protein
VRAVQAAIAAGRDGAACWRLIAFAQEVRAQTGKKIPPATAAALLRGADRVAGAVGC